MTIEVMALVTIISVCASVCFGFMNARRNQKSDDKTEATVIATVNVKLENIQKNVDEIKFDVKGIKAENQLLRDRVIAVEQSCKSAHHRIDTLEGKNAE